MDRFSLDSPQSLAHNYASRLDPFGEDALTERERDVDSDPRPECESCGQRCEHRTFVPGWEFLACDACAKAAFKELAEEPECSCRQLDADLVDVRGCQAHDPDSEWNRLQVALESEPVERKDVQSAKSIVDLREPFFPEAA